jgi:hypothetical protein
MADPGQDQMKQVDWTRFYSPDFITAKERFLEAAAVCKGKVASYQIGGDPSCTIDVAILGDHQAKQSVVVSSGLHGVEGFFGSAVQLAWLRHFASSALSSRLVMIHAINPVGFATCRRWNEANVDLNRNFLFANESYEGTPPSYAELDALLNPPSPPRRWEPFVAKAAWQILRRGMPVLKQAIAGGQYDFPDGCFYGGSEPCASTRVIQEHYSAWVGETNNVVHLDLHTGLGRRGAYKLLLEEPSPDNTGASSAYGWYVRAFGQDRVEVSTQDAEAQAKRTAYATKGSMGRWLHEQHRQHGLRRQQGENRGRRFRFAVVEFGTYAPLRVLSALRFENQAHHYAGPDSIAMRRSKDALIECFCPSSSRWRNAVTPAGVEVIEQAIQAAQDM